ncbi:MAG: hypothetical protein HFF80_00580 [Oscillospiraceae bacterium]|nr:hypothetical protein [Oscillospiraceae bacterium]
MRTNTSGCWTCWTSTACPPRRDNFYYGPNLPPAPAAYDTLSAHFAATGTGPKDYDLVLTGDLGVLGHQIIVDLFAQDGVDMSQNYQDCGMLLYDIEKQDMHAGASGCGCSASVLCGYLLREMDEGRWKKLLFAPTGALLSPTSSFQGESIPSICHAVTIEMQ